MARVSLLWSGVGDPSVARFTIFTANPYLTVAWRDGGARILGPDGEEKVATEDPFSLLAGLVARHPCGPSPPWPFQGGGVGFISYDAARALERLPSLAADDRPHAGLDFALYGWAIGWDHRRRRWGVLSTGAPVEREPGRWRRAVSVGEKIAAWAVGAAPPPGASRRDDAPQPAGRGEGPAEAAATLDRRAYKSAVTSIQERIARGDCYEVNLSRRLTVPMNPDPRRLFSALCRTNPAPFAVYLETSAGALAGSSPERFLRVRDGWAETRPIKGTAARGADAEADRAAAARLLSSGKDRAENVMIVDLARNDLGRVCAPGSVQVRTLCGLKSYAAVHHLVSTVAGRLAEGRGAMDAARALFPPGSMTGAPKIRAMGVIESVEPVRRGPYAGAAGYVAANGEADLSVVIRTLVLSDAGVDLQTGGAVVADSDPSQEYDESVVKAERALAALQEVLGGSLTVEA